MHDARLHLLSKMPFAGIRNLCAQRFPPSPSFTEKHVPSQQGKVFIVTGGNAGVGFELCKISLWHWSDHLHGVEVEGALSSIYDESLLS